MMSARRELSEGQQRFADLGIENVLVIAPAGCGKTEALAARVESLVRRELITPPRKALALTFSNKAKANLAARLRSTLGSGWGRHVDVMNLHGFSARIVSAHGKMIGLDPELEMPEKVWYGRAVASVGVNYTNSASFESDMRSAKTGAVDDATVMQRLEAIGNPQAIAFERLLREEMRLDFSDLLRHGRRILEVDQVRDLYRGHFAVVLVDEVQDLSWNQFELAHEIAADRASYAGDPAQGIYSFAGAEPSRVFAAIEAEAAETIRLNQCHRSSPAVIRAVNTLAERMGSTMLECAAPARFPDGGSVATVRASSPHDEASVLVDNALRLVDENPDGNVGFIVRRGARLDALRRELDVRHLSFEDWTSPTHVPQVVELLYRHVVIAEESAPMADEQLLRLEELSAESMEDWDIDLRGELAAACEELGNLIEQGMTLRQSVQSCKRASELDAPVGTGFHLLNAHIGKGQEFDWVIVVGLEDGHVPDFRANGDAAKQEELRTLHVMVSRAKTGLAITTSEQTETKYGLRSAVPSPWWACLETTATESWS
jgi:DNA helicase-2/ATP-dependent DNA helicase PcrA